MQFLDFEFECSLMYREGSFKENPLISIINNAYKILIIIFVFYFVNILTIELTITQSLTGKKEFNCFVLFCVAFWQIIY